MLPREATDESFEAEVLGSELACVEFRAPWCEASRLLSTSIARLAETHGHRIGVFQVNTDENPKTVARCTVDSIPAVVVFRAGTIKKRNFGFESFGSLRSMLEDVLTDAVGSADTSDSPRRKNHHADGNNEAQLLRPRNEHENSCGGSKTVGRESPSV